MGGGQVIPRARWSRPPERFSLDTSPSASTPEARQGPSTPLQPADTRYSERGGQEESVPRTELSSGGDECSTWLLPHACRRCREHAARAAGEDQSSQSAQRGRAVSRDAGQASGVASSLTVPRGRNLRSTEEVVSYSRGRATDGRARGQIRSPSVRAASGSGVTGWRSRREQQRGPSATKAGPSGVQSVIVRPAENGE